MVRKRKKRKKTKKNTEHWNSKKIYMYVLQVGVGKVVLTVKVHVWLEEFSLEFKSTL